MKLPQLSFPQLRVKNSAEIAKLTEVKYREKFRQKLSSSCDRKINYENRDIFLNSLPKVDVKRVVDAGILTFLLHWYAIIKWNASLYLDKFDLSKKLSIDTTTIQRGKDSL